MKKLGILLGALFVLTACAYKGSEGRKVEQPIAEVPVVENRGMSEGEADASHQEEANQGLHRLMVSFGRTPEGSDENIQYPDYYGGAYITEEGDLFIYLAGDEEEMDAHKQEIIASAQIDRIRFGTAEYSYAYLSELMDYLNNFMIEKRNPEVINNVSVFSLQDKENCVEVGLIDGSEEKIDEFKKHISNSPALRFKESGRIILQ